GEEALFRRLSVFVGGCTLQAAESVCAEVEQGAGERSVLCREHVLDGLASLVDKSLLQQGESAGAEPRFLMLETIHEYAAERLAEEAETDALQRRHAAYYLALAEEALPELFGPRETVWL